MQINVRNNFPEVKAGFARAEKQMPFALARALTFTARDVKSAEEEEITGRFDRPTPFTRKSVFMQTATKQRLQARVWLKDGDRPEHYLLPQIEGGPRPRKRFEDILVRAGYMMANERAVPGSGAVLDQYGNMSRGQIVKILSQLRANSALGFDANATDSKRSRKKRAKEAYFVAGGLEKTAVEALLRTCFEEYLAKLAKWRAPLVDDDEEPDENPALDDDGESAA